MTRAVPHRWQVERREVEQEAEPRTHVHQRFRNVLCRTLERGARELLWVGGSQRRVGQRMCVEPVKQRFVEGGLDLGERYPEGAVPYVLGESANTVYVAQIAAASGSRAP